jgi:hypothetical protein
MSKKFFILVCFGLVFGLVGSAWAQEAQVMVWTDAIGDHQWCNPGNWADGFLPTVWDYNYFDEGDSVDIDIPSMSHPAVISSGCESQASWVHVGLSTNVGVGLEITGGYFHGFEIIMGSEEGSSGTVIMSGGVVELDNYSYLGVGDGGNGTFIMTGGVVYVDGTIWNGGEVPWAGAVNIPKNEKGDGTGHLQLDGGTIVTRRLGINERGTMDITGGKMLITGNIYSSDLKTVNDYIDTGVLTAYGGSGVVGIIYDESDPNAVVELLGRVDAESAWNPEPADRASDIDRDAVISWQPGDYAGAHEVYFGTDLAAVNSRDGSVHKGQQPLSSTTYDAGALESLQLAETYYWAIDEVNGTQTWPGQVWRFTMDLGIAENPTPSNGADNILRDVVLSWYPGVDAANVAGHDIYFGTDFEDINTADTYSDIYIQRQDANSYNLGEATGLELATTYYWRIDEINDSNVWKGEVWRFKTNDGTASNPNPSHGSKMVPLDVVLSWSPGLDVASVAGHDVYFGTSFDDVNDANNTLPVGTSAYKGRQDPCSYNAGTEEDLQLANVYYWRVDEINDATLWKGHIWRFTVAEYFAIDDMESYKLSGSGKTEITNTWKSDWETSTAEIYLQTTDGDANYVHEGDNSMRYYYGNYSSPFVALAEIPFDSAQDWTVAGVKALTLYLRGDFMNMNEAGAIQPIYIEISDVTNTGTVQYDDSNDLVEGWMGWQEWNIELQAFVDDAPFLNLAAITKLGIKVGDGTEADAGYNVYFDDIRLYPSRCVVAKATGSFTNDCDVDIDDLEVLARDWLLSSIGSVSATVPSDTDIHGYWMMNDNAATSVVLDSSVNDNNGVLYDEVVSEEPSEGTTAAHSVVGMDGGALEFDGVDDYVELPALDSISNTITITAWVKRAVEGHMYDGIVMSSNEYDPCDEIPGPNYTAGLQFGSNPDWIPNYELSFMWTGYSWEWHTELFVAPEEWTFTALTVAPEVATLYLSDGISLQAARNYDNYEPLPWNTSFHIADQMQFGPGGDEPGGERYFPGAIDDVRIYSRTLSPEEIASLAGVSSAELGLEPWRVDTNEDDIVNFPDFVVIADNWLAEILWP